MNKTLKEFYKRKKVLFFDIETSPNVGLFFTAGYKLNIDTDAILKERQIICISWMWGDSKKVEHLDWGLKKQSDKELLKKFSKVISLADIIIGHNSDRFDIKWLRGRLAFHNLPDINTVQTYDTLKLAKKVFNLNSFKLKYIAKYLQVGAKDPMEFNDWKMIMKGSKPHLDKMLKYCDKDVVVDRNVFEKIFPYVSLTNMHFGSLLEGNKEGCPRCGQEERSKDGTRITTSGMVYQRYKCNACGYKFKGERL